jgi:hypothetical protein
MSKKIYSRLSKYPNETTDEYITRRDALKLKSNLTDFTSVEELTKQINEIEEGFFKIQEILMKCSRVSRKKIRQRFITDYE